MVYLRYEIIKLISQKYIRVVLLLLLCINICVGYYRAGSLTNDNNPPDIVTNVDLYLAAQNVTDRAEANISILEMKNAQLYEIAYQKKSAEVYYSIKNNVVLPETAVTGWGEFFGDTSANIFVSIIIIILVSDIFIRERASGFSQILYTTAKGRSSVVRAKFTAAFLVSIAISFIFTLCSFAVYAVFFGYSSFAVPVQAIREFILYPRMHTIGQFLCVNLFLRAVSCAVFGLLISVISIIADRYALSFFSGGALYLAFYLLYKTDLFGRSLFISAFDYISVSNVSPLYYRFRGANIFGNALPLETVLIFVYILSVIILTVCGLLAIQKRLRGSRASASVLKIIFDKLSSAFPKSLKYRPSISIFCHEIYKTLSLVCFPLFVLVVIKILLSSSYFAENNMYDDMTYKTYSKEIEGVLTDDKYAYIAKEEEYIYGILEQLSYYENLFAAGQVSVDDYISYHEKYNYAILRSEPLRNVGRHVKYLESTKAETGIEVQFFYDTGWKLLFDNSVDITLFAALLLISALSFSREYKSHSSEDGFVKILRTAKNGRKKTFLCKYASAITISAVFILIFCGIDCIFLFKNYYMPAWKAPLISIERFSAVHSGITVLQYFIFYHLLKLISFLLFTMIACTLSQLIRRDFIVMAAVSMTAFLPYMLLLAGLDTFAYIDYTTLMRATPAYMKSVETFIGGDFVFLTVSFVFWAAVASVLTALSCKKFLFGYTSLD